MEQHTVQQTKGRILCIGDTLHIGNPAFVRAVTSRNRAALAGLARAQLEGGADGLALNLGPAAAMRGHLGWILETLPATGQLFLWADALGEKSLLEACPVPVIINAVTAEPDGLARSMEAALAVRAGLVVLLARLGLGGNAEEQLLVIAEVLAQAKKTGFPVDRLFLDPLLACHRDPHARRLGRGLPDLQRLTDVLEALPFLGVERPRSIVGLSNITAPSPRERGRLQCSVAGILAAAGLDAVLCDCRDQRLMEQLQQPFLATAA